MTNKERVEHYARVMYLDNIENLTSEETMTELLKKNFKPWFEKHKDDIVLVMSAGRCNSYEEYIKGDNQ